MNELLVSEGDILKYLLKKRRGASHLAIELGEHMLLHNLTQP